MIVLAVMAVRVSRPTIPFDTMQVHVVDNVKRKDEKYWLPGQPEEAYFCVRVSATEYTFHPCMIRVLFRSNPVPCIQIPGDGMSPSPLYTSCWDSFESMSFHLIYVSKKSHNPVERLESQ